MLGPPNPRRLDQSIAVSLEELVPRDRFYGSFVRERTDHISRASTAQREMAGVIFL
jgi:hypothetical protein